MATYEDFNIELVGTPRAPVRTERMRNDRPVKWVGFLRGVRSSNAP